MPSRRALLLSATASAISPRVSAQVVPPAASTPIILQLQNRTIEVNGRAAKVYGITQPNGTRGLFTAVGEAFRVRVENHVEEPSLLHWHGLTPPWRQDGVPEVSGPPIKPAGSAEYDFPLPFGGTFWMHSHVGLQEQLLMAAPLVIGDARVKPGEQEILLGLQDFSFAPPAEIFEGLRKGAAAPGMKMSMAQPSMQGSVQRAAGEVLPRNGLPAAAPAPDLDDVAYDALLANERTLGDPEVVRVEPGASVFLRVINMSAMSSYHLDLGALAGTLVAVDGFLVAPVPVRQVPVSVAQRVEIRIAIPKGAGAYPLLAALEGGRMRTGIVLQAGGAQVTRVAERTEAASPAITLDLERQLRAAAPPPVRAADRVHRIDLTGDMARYVWSLNGVAWSPDVAPLPVKQGERVELVLTNRTGMPHPMHLHGHTVQVVAIDGVRFPGAMRDTVLVPPNRQVVVAFDADNPGHWAFHCHMLYHMEAGMFQTVRYV